jgi:protein-S-isoprenylcysteine O-methyltransferase Ste14
MLTLELRIPPPVVGAIVAAAMWGATTGGAAPAPLSVLQMGVCAALGLAGVGFDVAGLLAFRASRTTINPLTPQRSRALVTSGVYRLTRNPMYVGMALLLSAWAVALGSPWAAAGPLAFVLYITRWQIRPEERVLQALFGPDYADYCQRVRRWL